MGRISPQNTGIINFLIPQFFHSIVTDIPLGFNAKVGIFGMKLGHLADKLPLATANFKVKGFIAQKGAPFSLVCLETVLEQFFSFIVFQGLGYPGLFSKRMGLGSSLG